MKQPEPHPDLPRDYYRLKEIERGSMQAIETSAMNAMWDALEEGRSREEAEKVFFSFFNYYSHGKQKQAGVPAANS